jgi:hypothetical protein
MEKKKQNKIYWLIALIAIALIILINIYSYYREGESLSSELMVTLIVGILSSGVGAAIFILTRNTNKNVDGLTDRVDKLEDSVLTITKKDLEEAEKFEIYYNAQIELSDNWNAKKDIVELGKKIQKKYKRIIKNHYKLNQEFSDFITKIVKSLKDLITSEYEYGVEALDLEDYEIFILENVNRIVEETKVRKLDKQAFEKSKLAVFDNINTYIKELDGVQDLLNGKRRKKFEEKTLDFIGYTTNHVIEEYLKYENKKEIA